MSKDEDNPQYTRHVFICENCQFETPDGPSSQDCALNLRKNLKELAKKKCAKSEVRINASGCLGECGQAIACVIYPEGKWILGLRPGDEEKILDEITK